MRDTILDELPVELQLDTYAEHTTTFIRRHAPGSPGDPEYVRFIEDLRRLVIFAKVNFFLDQTRGNFVDGTGLKYLQRCLDTFKTEEKDEGEEQEG